MCIASALTQRHEYRLRSSNSAGRCHEKISFSQRRGAWCLKDRPCRRRVVFERCIPTCFVFQFHILTLLYNIQYAIRWCTSSSDCGRHHIAYDFVLLQYRVQCTGIIKTSSRLLHLFVLYLTISKFSLVPPNQHRRRRAADHYDVSS